LLTPHTIAVVATAAEVVGGGGIIFEATVASFLFFSFLFSLSLSFSRSLVWLTVCESHNAAAANIAKEEEKGRLKDKSPARDCCCRGGPCLPCEPGRVVATAPPPAESVVVVMCTNWCQSDSSKNAFKEENRKKVRWGILTERGDKSVRLVERVEKSTAAKRPARLARQAGRQAGRPPPLPLIALEMSLG
jgi:hypothetical protein